MALSFTKILSKQGGVFSANQNILSHVVPESVADFQDYTKSYYNHFPSIATTTYNINTTTNGATPAAPQRSTAMTGNGANSVEPVVYGYGSFDYNTAAIVRHSKWLSAKKGELEYNACINHFNNTMDKLTMDIDEKKNMAFFGSGADASNQCVVKRSPFVKLGVEDPSTNIVPAGSYTVPCVQVPVDKLYGLASCDMVDSSEMGDIELYTELENIKQVYDCKPAFNYHSVNFGTANNANGIKDCLTWGVK